MNDERDVGPTPGGRGVDRVRVGALAILTLVIVAGALGTPLRDVGLPSRGSVIDLAVAASAVLGLMIGGLRWWRLLPRPLLVLGAVQIVLSAGSVAWAANRSAALQSTLSCVVGVLAALLVVGAASRLREGWRPLAWWGVACVVPCLLLWTYVPGFAPPITSTMPDAGTTLMNYFARLSHPWIGPSNNIAALLVPLVVPLAYLTLRVSRWVVVPFLLVVGALAGTLSRGGLLAVAATAVLWLVLARGHRRRTLTLALPAAAMAMATAAFVLFAHPALDRSLAKTYPPAAAAHDFADRRDPAPAAVPDAGQAEPTGQAGQAVDTTVSTTTLLAGRTGADGGLDNGRLALLEQGIAKISLLGRGAGYELHVHNAFVQQLVDFGWVGGTISVGLMLAFTMWWFRVGLRGRRDLAALAMGCGILAQMGSFLLESSYEGDLLRRTIWIEWGLLVAAYLALRRQQSPPADDAVAQHSPSETAELHAPAHAAKE